MAVGRGGGGCVGGTAVATAGPAGAAPRLPGRRARRRRGRRGYSWWVSCGRAGGRRRRSRLGGCGLPGSVASARPGPGGWWCRGARWGSNHRGRLVRCRPAARPGGGGCVRGGGGGNRPDAANRRRSRRRVRLPAMDNRALLRRLAGCADGDAAVRPCPAGRHPSCVAPDFARCAGPRNRCSVRGAFSPAEQRVRPLAPSPGPDAPSRRRRPHRSANFGSRRHRAPIGSSRLA